MNGESLTEASSVTHDNNNNNNNHVNGNQTHLPKPNGIDGPVAEHAEYPPSRARATPPPPLMQPSHDTQTLNIPQPPHPSMDLPSKEAAPAPPLRTIYANVAKNPNRPVSRTMGKMFPKSRPFNRFIRRFGGKHSIIRGLTEEELAELEEKGPEIRRKAGWKLPGEQGDGAEVSPLFWKIYLSTIPTVERDPLSGITSPDLLGSTTTMPLSIISLIPDIMKHYADVIVRAQKEIFLATNYWQPSDSVNTVCRALRDLSARVVAEGRPKVVVKIMYDRGSWEQLWNSHAPVTSSTWVKLDLPDEKEVPGLNIEVIVGIHISELADTQNFHKVLLGTFHVKFMIVDRKVTLINSCNIQDRPNLEMMSHMEGPVVDSFYDIALHSWYNKLEPMLPCINQPYQPPRDEDGNVKYLFRDHNPYFRDIEVLKAARAARLLLRRQTKEIDDERLAENAHPTRDRLVEAVRQAMARQQQNFAHTQEGFAHRSATAMKELRGFGERMGMNFEKFGGSSRPGSRRASATDLTKLRHQDNDDETAAITAANQMATRPAPSDTQTSPTLHEFPAKSQTMPEPSHPHFTLTDDDQTTVNSSRRQSFHSALDGYSEGGHMARTESPAVLREVTESPENETGPGFQRGVETLAVPGEAPRTASPFEDPEETNDEPQPHPNGSATPTRTTRWVDDLPSGAQTPQPYIPKVSIDEEIPPGRGTKRMFKLSKRFNAGALSEAWATVEDSDELDNFRPHVIHAPHEPFPVAMVCRRPHGVPGHHDLANPQNAAWLAGCRYAQRKVFIQTPTFNARPLVRAVKQACRRGVEVILFLDLGFNDMAESIMFQGGTNEQVVDRLYKKLGKEGKSKYLKVYWYTSKDQIRPLNAIIKQRNCHIKFAAYDDEVMIFGNANGDTQSVFHSGEVNVMVDNKQTVAEVMDALMANQNTLQYGGVQGDGVWRDEEGKTLADYGATGGGGFVQGIKAFIRFAKTAAK